MLTALGLAAPFAPAAAQTAQTDASRLFAAPFSTVSNAAARPLAMTRSGAFVPAPQPAVSARLVPGERLVAGGLEQWRATEVSRTTRSGAIDTVRLSVGAVARAPGGVVTAAPNDLMSPDAKAYDVTYTRDWPGAVRFAAGDYDGDVTPYAGLGLGTQGGSAQAGAMLRYGPGASSEDRVLARLAKMGVRDGAAFGDAGRWYVFAAASGRAVGMNMARNADGDMRNAGWSTDTAALIGDAQVGLAWRKGSVQTSVGYLHREFEPRNPLPRTDFVDDDQMVALSISIKPQR